jgi:alpha-L-rhamnosidase
MNHCMLGHVQEWFLGHVAGIRPDPAAPGFARFFVAPQPVGDLTWARGSYESVRGRIVSDWRQTDSEFELSVVVPANTVAVVSLPAASAAAVEESGRAPTNVSGVRFLRWEAGRAVLEVGGGEYHFRSRR